MIVAVPELVTVVSVCGLTLKLIVPPFVFAVSVTVTIPVPASVTGLDPLVFVVS